MVRELKATFFGGEEVQEIFHSRGFRYTRWLSHVFSDYVAYVDFSVMFNMVIILWRSTYSVA